MAQDWTIDAGSIGLGRASQRGADVEPSPPAMTTAFIKAPWAAQEAECRFA